MLIPSIDLMGGKVVQLVQGEKKALEFDDLQYWIDRFLPYPMVQLIDLDAAMGKGENTTLIHHICQHLPVQVGGGIRSVEAASKMLQAGAKKVIIGSALLKNGAVDLQMAKDLAHYAAPNRLLFAVDSRGGKVSIKGWQEGTTLTPAEMMEQTGEYCSGYLYTHIDTEGTMSGFPFEVVATLKAATTRKLIVAGGIKSMDEVNRLDAEGVDAVVGMAVYTGALKA
jgi:phosphoribosylformimino-5-aminoimidazole carboxamide ribotide isomerase